MCRLAFPLSSVFVWLGRVLFISRDPLHREETMLSVESVSYRSVSLSLVCLWLPLFSGCVCWHWHSIPISLCELSNTSIFFYFSTPSSFVNLRSLVPLNTSKGRRTVGRREGVWSKEETEWVDLHTPYISALILLHPRQVPEHLTDWGDLVKLIMEMVCCHWGGLWLLALKRFWTRIDKNIRLRTFVLWEIGSKKWEMIQE